SPIGGLPIFTAPAERDAALESNSASRRAELALNRGVEGAIARLQTSLHRAEARQTVSLSSLEESYDSKLKRMRGVLAELGLRHPPHGIAEPPSGGPFVPYRLASTTGAFDGQVNRVALARAQTDKLARVMAALPLRRPVTG